MRSRFDYLDEDQSQLWINCELEMPIAGCGSVLLTPNSPEIPPETGQEA